MRMLQAASLSMVLFWLVAQEVNPLLGQGAGKAKSGADMNTPPTTPFTKVVREHFKAWDLNGDGGLDLDEIETALLSPRNKGDAAAAIATLRYVERYFFFKKDKKFEPITLLNLTKYETDMAAKRDPDWDCEVVYEEGKLKLKNTSRELFPDKVPLLSGVRQGYVGDCWFLCVVGSMTHMQPDKLVNMIKEEKKGHYAVSFPNLKTPIVVPTPTDGEIALAASAEKNGLWLSVLEKAYGKVINRQQTAEEKTKFPTDSLSGGNPRVACADLTGHSYLSSGDTIKSLKESLNTAVSGKCVIWTKRREARVPGVYYPHLHAVLDYDAKKDLVTVFDPIAGDFTPKGKPGPENGFEKKAGIMNMSLKHFDAVFTGISYEDPNTPVPKQKK